VYSLAVEEAGKDASPVRQEEHQALTLYCSLSINRDLALDALMSPLGEEQNKDGKTAHDLSWV